MIKNQPTGQGRNSVNLRRYNERLLLRALRRAGTASKADLARMANLTNTAVGEIIASLAESDLIEATGTKVLGLRGQPASLIRLNPRGAYGIGVRLDRMRVEVVLVNFGGEMISSQTYETQLPDPDTVLKLVTEEVGKMVKLLPKEDQHRLAGVGVAQPFNLGSWLRELDLPSQAFKAWAEVDFAANLAGAIDLPVFSENDGNAATIAELFYGCGRERDDFVYLFMGPVIGGGIAVDGDCFRGRTGNAGDFAVMPVEPSKLASVPAARSAWDILLSRTSLSTLIRHLRYSGESVATRADVESCIARKVPAVDEWIDDCVDALASTLRSVLSIVDSPTIVIDADIRNGFLDTVIERLTDKLAAITPEARGLPEFVRGSFGPDAGAIGAATLPMFFNFSPRTSILKGANLGAPEASYIPF